MENQQKTAINRGAEMYKLKMYRRNLIIVNSLELMLHHLINKKLQADDEEQKDWFSDSIIMTINILHEYKKKI